jgi:hypothetical protein
MKLSDHAKQYSITAGPSKWDLMLCLFDYIHHNAEFTIHAPENGKGLQEVRVVVFITSLEREDGSGESWNYEGYLVKMDGSPVNLQDRNVKGCYSTQRRSGHIFLPF